LTLIIVQTYFTPKQETRLEKMKTKTSRMAACAFILLLFLTHGMMAHGQLQPGTGKRPAVKIIYGALTTSNAPIWIGADQGFMKNMGSM
jgi:hypothetical protein